jgi:hypothetical protein
MAEGPARQSLAVVSYLLIVNCRVWRSAKWQAACLELHSATSSKRGHAVQLYASVIERLLE